MHILHPDHKTCKTGVFGTIGARWSFRKPILCHFLALLGILTFFRDFYGFSVFPRVRHFCHSQRLGCLHVIDHGSYVPDNRPFSWVRELFLQVFSLLRKESRRDSLKNRWKSIENRSKISDFRTSGRSSVKTTDSLASTNSRAYAI